MPFVYLPKCVSIVLVGVHFAGFQIEAVGPCDGFELFGGKKLTRFAVQHEDEPGSPWMNQQLALLAVPGHIDENVLHDLVVVKAIVRFDLISPFRHAGLRIARPDGDGPFVIAGTHVGIPDAGISGAVIDEVEFGIIGDPAPDGAAAELPLAGSPRFYAQVFALILRVEGLEIRPDAHVGVWPRTVRSPEDLPGVRIESCQLSAYAKLRAAIADEDNVIDDDWRSGDGFAKWMSPTCVFHASLPVLASTATVCASSVL